MLHCAPSPTPPYVIRSPVLPRPVFTRVHVDPQLSERQISSFCEPVPSHTLRESKGSTMIAAPTVPFTATVPLVDFPTGVIFSHTPAAGRLSQVPTGGGATGATFTCAELVFSLTESAVGALAAFAAAVEFAFAADAAKFGPAT